MEALTAEYINHDNSARKVTYQPEWLRILLLGVLAYEATDCLAVGPIACCHTRRTPDGYAFENKARRISVF